MNLPQIRAELERIRDRVRRNEPSRRDPEAYHVEKSEIAHDLNAIISICPTYSLLGQRETLEGRISAEDFETLVTLAGAASFVQPGRQTVPR